MKIFLTKTVIISDTLKIISLLKQKKISRKANKFLHHITELLQKWIGNQNWIDYKNSILPVNVIYVQVNTILM